MRAAPRLSLLFALLLTIGPVACAKSRGPAAPGASGRGAPGATSGTAPGAAAGTAAAQTAAATPISDPARLRMELGAIFDDPAVNALWGVHVQSLDTGEVLFQRNAYTLVMPASNQKILTMSVAADQLGWDFRFQTELRTRGTIEGGVLKGDLVVVGGGDPTISDRGGSRTRVFESWADQLRTAGVTSIDGRIVGDDDQFDDQTLGDGWAWDDLVAGYSAAGGALQFNENVVRVVITPAATAGEPARLRFDPEGSGLTLRATVLTVGAGLAPRVSTFRRPGSTTLEVSGVVPVGEKETTRTVSVENPTIFFVNALRDTLISKGITVTGPAVDVDDIGPLNAPAAGAAGAAAATGDAKVARVNAQGTRRDVAVVRGGMTTHPSGAPMAAAEPWRVLLTHQSPPLTEVGMTFMKVSQNLFGETLLATIGARRVRAALPEVALQPVPTTATLTATATPTTPTPTTFVVAPTSRESYVQAAREVYENVLAGWGITPAEHIVSDGSGLSRYNYVTAHGIAQILRQMARDPKHAAAFEAALPIAGKDGTLSQRMKGTKAENNVHAKTGTLMNVRSLSGYLRTLTGERIVFSIIANNFKAPTPAVDAVAELAVERLANFARKP